MVVVCKTASHKLPHGKVRNVGKVGFRKHLVPVMPGTFRELPGPGFTKNHAQIIVVGEGAQGHTVFEGSDVHYLRHNTARIKHRLGGR